MLNPKAIVKAAIAMTPYRVVRDRGANRFHAHDAALLNMRARGFMPSAVIDGGAHLGEFSINARRIFPSAPYHLVEPQPACLPQLRRLCAAEGFDLHEVALSDVSGTVALAHSPGQPGTGAYVARQPVDDPTIPVTAATLDDLFAETLAPGVLLKMDLQGSEIRALEGARRLLPKVDAILTEVSFYGWSLSAMIALLHDNGFEIYDVAALIGRRRDNRLHYGDLVFARRDGALAADSSWE